MAIIATRSRNADMNYLHGSAKQQINKGWKFNGIALTKSSDV